MRRSSSLCLVVLLGSFLGGEPLRADPGEPTGEEAGSVSAKPDGESSAAVGGLFGLFSERSLDNELAAPAAPTEAARPESSREAAGRSPEETAAAHGDGGEIGREIELPSEEIRGELEKPEIFFLLPHARGHTDEQVIRARIRREITRPLIKDWLEEELLLR